MCSGYLSFSPSPSVKKLIWMQITMAWRHGGLEPFGSAPASVRYSFYNDVWQIESSRSSHLRSWTQRKHKNSIYHHKSVLNGFYYLIENGIHKTFIDQLINQIFLAGEHIIRAVALLFLVAVLLIPRLLSLGLTPGAGL